MSEQAEIIRAASEFVKPGGRMIYATCSFLIEEDEDCVSGFLSEAPDFSQASAASSVIASGLLTEEGERVVRGGQTSDGSVRLTPKSAGTDGFFFAVLQRKAS